MPQKEMETHSDAQLAAIFQAAPAGWSRMAIQILLGTGMRISELAALTLEDVEDDGEVMFLKLKRGKGAKFRRMPVSSRDLPAARPLLERAAGYDTFDHCDAAA